MKLVFLLTFIFFANFSGALADLVIETIEVESNVLLGQGIQDGERLQVQPDGEVHIFVILVHSCVSQSPYFPFTGTLLQGLPDLHRGEGHPAGAHGDGRHQQVQGGDAPALHRLLPREPPGQGALFSSSEVTRS